MKYIYVFIIAVFLFSCDNMQKANNNDVFYDISENGDSITYFKNEKGKPEGKFLLHKNDGEFAEGYFKNGERDSILRVFREDSSLKMSTYFINGKENGIKRYYTPLNNCYLYFFVENDIEKMKYVVYVDSIDDYRMVQSYRIEGDTDVYTGKLLFDKNLNSVIDRIDGELSTASVVNGIKSNDNLIGFTHKNNNFKIKYFRLCENSKVEIKFGKLTSKHTITDVYYHDTIDSSGIFDYSTSSAINGWNFVRALITEECEDGQKRYFPLYFNFYLY